MRRVVVPALAALLACHAQAQAADWTAADAAIRKEIAARGYTGVSLIALEHGKPVFVGSYGFADLEHGVPVKPETVFQSGSIGKMFTATAVMLLAQDGKLSLDDSLAKYFPDGPAYWKRATLRQVLSHRAGVPDYEEKTSPASPGIDIRRDYSDEDLVRVIGAAPMDFEPGTDYRYSNSGYVLLGLVIGQASGQFYGDYLAERLFGPLGMVTARVNDIDAVVANRASSYERNEAGGLRHAAFVSRSIDRTADGSLLFSVLDLARWDAALHGDAFLPREQGRSMWQSQPFGDGTRGLVDYGMGWETRQVRGHRLVEHGGWWQGFNAYLGRYVDDGFTIAVLCNSDWARDDLRSLASLAASFHDPDYAEYRPVADDKPELTARLAAHTRAWLAGRDSAQAARLAAALQFEKEPRFELVHERPAEPGLVREYRMSDGELSAIVRYALGSDGGIRDFAFQPD